MNNMNKTTIVSCFLANSNNRNDRKTDKYMEYGRKLLNVDVPKIIFMDDSLIHLFQCDKTHTQMIPFNKNDIYLYDYINNINKFNVITDFPHKDTLEYILLICNKTEIMRRAVDMNTFSSEQFIWVDFGINHIFKCNEIEFEEKMIMMTMKEYNKIRIGSIVDPFRISLYKNIFREVVWYFAGGIFGGEGIQLIKFADLVKEKCIEVIFNNETIMWEVNIWYLVFTENKDLFDPYICDHNESLVTNY